jgi:hypothetical protein
MNTEVKAKDMSKSLARFFECNIFVSATSERRDVRLEDLDGVKRVLGEMPPKYAFLVNQPSRDIGGRPERIDGVVQYLCSSGHVFLRKQAPAVGWEGVYPENIAAVLFPECKGANVLLVGAYDPKAKTLRGKLGYISQVLS